MERVLKIMKCVSEHIPTDRRETLISDLRDRLLRFDSPPELIAVSVSTLAKVRSSTASSRSSDFAIKCEEGSGRVFDRGGHRIPGKGVHIYNGMGGSLWLFCLIFFKYPMKMK